MVQQENIMHLPFFYCTRNNQRPTAIIHLRCFALPGKARLRFDARPAPPVHAPSYAPRLLAEMYAPEDHDLLRAEL